MKLPARKEKTPAIAAEEISQPASSWSHGKTLGTKFSSAVLLVALVCGPTAVALNVFGGGADAAAATGPTKLADRSPEQAAGEYGLRYVTTWLRAVRGQEAAVTGYMGGSGAASVRLGQTAFTAAEPVVASVSQVDPDHWAVTIAATVSSPGSAPVRRYFAVGIARGTDQSGLVALSLPAAVSGPAAGTPPTSGYTSSVSASSAVWVTCQGFLDSLLTGKTDLSRFTSPGSGFTGVNPPPYTQVTVQSIESSRGLVAADESPVTGSQTRVLVTALAEAGDVSSPVQYPLTVTARDGRWEVRLINQLPLLADADAAPVPSKSS